MRCVMFGTDLDLLEGFWAWWRAPDGYQYHPARFQSRSTARRYAEAGYRAAWGLK